MTDFTSFQVLLDDPALQPSLGFDGYADSLAQILLHSDAQFCVGIFGEWGSGKTTLMRAVERRLRLESQVVTVWFNAWRYEREPHLMVPLLDSLREALVDWSEAQATPSEQPRARRAAAGIARAAKALLAGMSVGGAVPGLKFNVDGKKILDSLAEQGDDEATDAQSFYHAGFNAMRSTVREFAFDDPATGRRADRRIVVFVDDLDRCLPSNALEVLEAMKVLFDLEGFVFVVGLAQSVIDEAVRMKYAAQATEVDAVRGTEYSKKLFQVPFSLPRIRTDQLEEYYHSLVVGNELPGSQVQDLNTVVARHLRYLSGDDTVNPREVKRFVNAYTLQMKMLSHRLGPNVNADVVLALQILNFRPDWRDLYDLLAADPAQFRDALREAVSGEDVRGMWLGEEDTPLPISFVGYLRDEGAALMEVDDLGPYVTSAEFTRSVDPDLREAQSVVRELRRHFSVLRASTEIDSETASSFRKAADVLGNHTLQRHGPLANDLRRLVDRLRRRASDISPDTWGSIREQWGVDVAAIVEQIGQTLAELRRLARGAVA